MRAAPVIGERMQVGRQGDKGGQLLRVEIAEAAPLGPLRGWDRARPILQWSVTK